MLRGERNIDMAKQTRKRFFLPLLGLIAAQFVFLSPPATDTSFSLTLDRPMETNPSGSRIASGKTQGGIHGQLRDRSVSHEGLWKSFISEDHRSIPTGSDEARTTPSLRGTVGMSPTPLVFLTQFLARSTLTDKIVYFLFVLCYSLCIFNWLLKNHPDI